MEQEYSEDPGTYSYKARWLKWSHLSAEPCCPKKYSSVFLKAKHIKPKKISWLIRDLFPVGEITLIVGDPCVGKTTITVSIAALVSNSNLSHPFGEKGSIRADIHGKVLWVAFEDSVEATLIPRALAADADPENLALWTPRRSKGYIPPQKSLQESEMFQQIRACPGVVLVVFDHVDLIYTDYPETRSGRKQALLDITNLARQMGFAILANAHYTKSAARTTNPLDRISGGSLLGQTVRKVMFVEEMPRDDSGTDAPTYALFDAKASNSNVVNGLQYVIESAEIPDGEDTIPTSKIRWLGHVEHKQIKELESRSRKSYKPQAKICIEDAVAFVHEFLAEGARLSSDLNAAAKSANISNKLLSSAKTELGVQSKKQEQAGQFSRWLCCLPEHDLASSYSEALANSTGQVNQVSREKPSILVPEGSQNPEN